MEAVQILDEGWVRFRRFNCITGHIDVWQGDCINDPNRPNKSQLQLNAMTTYFRKDQTWFHHSNFERGFMSTIRYFMDTCSSDEIWSTCVNKYQPKS